MRIGIAISMQDDLREKLCWASEHGFHEVQLQLWNMEHLCDEHAQMVRKLLAEVGMICTSLWCGWHGPISWTFERGPAVLGLVPPEYRSSRTQNLLDGARYARALGVEQIVTHLGFVPTNRLDSNYVGVVNALTYITGELKKEGQAFGMETGQEPPVVLKRLIEDVGTNNLFVNYDPANLMMYGSANPIDGLELLGSHVRTIHAKDGSYPINGHDLGTEYPIGKGKVDFPHFVAALKKMQFDGPLYIEHEIEVSDHQQQDQILQGKQFLESLLLS